MFISLRKCNAVQKLLHALAVKVNQMWREKVEKNKEYDVSRKFNDNETNIIASLAKNKTNAGIILDKLWDQFGTFTEIYHNKKREMIMNELSKEVIKFESRCLKNETCWSIVEKMSRSIKALSHVTNQPKYFGNFLGYHVSRLFKSDSYIQPKLIDTFDFWPRIPFSKGKPEKLEIDFSENLMNMTFALSRGKLQNVSLLDLPSFGSTFDFDNNLSCHKTAWSLQLNMAIYDGLMSSNNNMWSKNFSSDIYNECQALKGLWNKYMSDSKAADFPPKVQKNNFFNFTNSIKKDMQTFLLAYAASFPNLLDNTTIWSEIAKILYIETNFENDVRKVGNYDKLVMNCVFQEPLTNHKSEAYEECRDLIPVVTDNGLCYSFNGIETSKLWRQTLRDSEIVQAFLTVFGTEEEQTRHFRGVGHSEGKCIRYLYTLVIFTTSIQHS